MAAILLRFGILLAATVASSADNNECARTALVTTEVTDKTKEAITKALRSVQVEIGDTVQLFVTLSDDITYMKIEKSTGETEYYRAAKDETPRRQNSGDSFNEKLQSCADLTTASNNDEPPLSEEASKLKAEFSGNQA
ncbi:unnamed protein product [Nippostrongylus brasiliensis]|uniref:Signal peptide-containing protein n=1 Tax=Nippostrongylus brasiliensis TaxID=27835 RepID=A0A0N4XD89_NIPBR|nr:unnamed protein product [Nippostrongylus brasiliensis]